MAWLVDGYVVTGDVDRRSGAFVGDTDEFAIAEEFETLDQAEDFIDQLNASCELVDVQVAPAGFEEGDGFQSGDDGGAGDNIGGGFGAGSLWEQYGL